jgi:hypothetical protein
MKKKNIALVIIFLMLICCFSTFGAIWKVSSNVIHQFQGNQTESAMEDQKVLEDISKRTGLEPNWMAIRTHVYCDLVKPGTPRSVVDAGLSQIGEYDNSGLGLTQEIYFKNRLINVNLSPIIIYYDTNYFVVDSGAGEGNYGDRSDCELDKAKTPTMILTP